MRYIKQFEALGADDLAVAGAKGANLGELTRTGFPVPPGFVLTTAAYDAFVDANDLAAPIRDLAAGPGADQGEYERAAEKLQELFLAGRVPADVAAELTAAYEELGGAVAVRSSATADDLPGAGFAGQQESFLHVRGAAVVAEAVRACWASLWTARAMAYRERRGLDPTRVHLAVVVQRMVDADAAGVLFTADPVSGRRDRAVISATWGLGEAVVGGVVTSDDLVVDKATGAVVSRTTADKQVMILYADHGTRERPVPENRRGEPVLDDAAAAELGRLGLRIEKHFGTPQDIEWTRAAGELFVVQTRPIRADEVAAEPAEPPRRPVGDLVTVIGMGHTAIGLVGHRRALAAIARDGLIDTVRGRSDREEALWFLVSGAALVVTGRLAAWTERRTGTLPASTGALLLGLGVVGAAVMPRSGFWTLIPAGVAALRVHHAARTNETGLVPSS